MSETSKKVPNYNSEWYVWTVRPSKIDIVLDFIEEHIPQINEHLYPTVLSKRETKKGKIKEKKKPLYEGYLFLQYRADPKVWHTLNNHPFVSNYVGRCTRQELYSVYNLQNTQEEKISPSTNIKEGNVVRVKSGSFNGAKGEVLLVRPNYIQVSLKAFGRNSVKSVFDPEDLEIIEND